MRVRYFTVPVLDSEAAERELNAFLATHRVSNVQHEFVSLGGGAVWAVAVTFQANATTQPTAKSSKPKIDYREVLPPEQFAVYAKLRSLRKSISDEEGIPLYGLFTNAQLADMIRRNVRTGADLESLHGVGPARVAKYGERFLAVLHTEDAATTSKSTQDEANSRQD